MGEVKAGVHRWPSQCREVPEHSSRIKNHNIHEKSSGPTSTSHGRWGAGTSRQGGAKVPRWHADHGIKLLPNWPGSSPDLNPIKNMWGVMKRHIEKENPMNLEGIKKIILWVWRALNGDFLKKLYDCMPHRMDLVIKAKGGVTKY